jgi:pyrroline-5-carboxylate reductase
MNDTIAFVGGGNMAASLIGGLLAAGGAAARIRVAVRSADSAARVRERFGVDAGIDVQAATDGADIIVLAIKPQQFAAAAAGLRPAGGSTTLSVMAGIRCATLRRCLGADTEIVRSMPNTPALVRRGATGLYAPDGTSARARTRAEAIVKSVGGACWVDTEDALDAVTALSGCGPAYFFRLVEALRDAGVALGLDATTARHLAFDTFTGAAALAAARDEDVAELRRQVTSRGGATEAALERLDAGGFDALWRAALTAACERSRERGLAADREISS